MQTTDMNTHTLQFYSMLKYVIVCVATLWGFPGSYMNLLTWATIQPNIYLLFSIFHESLLD